MRDFDLKLIPTLIMIFSVFLAVSIPYKVLGFGYLPQDDATRHSAKVVSGKEWNEILVLRDDIKMDSHPGWHFLLGVVHKATQCSVLDLMVFSVAVLFFVFAAVPLFLTKRPEAWLLTLLIMAIAHMGLYYRLLLGRPFIFNMAYMTAILLTWARLKERPLSPWFLSSITLFAALSTWIHCGWYLFALPCLALFLARERRAAAVLSLTCFAGTALGACLTGHPFLFLAQTIRHFFAALWVDAPQYVLVSEFQPAPGDFHLLILLALFIALRFIRNKRDIGLAADPVFILLCLCWVLGFLTGRVWIDIGSCALTVWITGELGGILADKMGFFSLKRLLFSAALMCVLYLAVTNDAYARWSFSRPGLYVTPATVGEADASWLPEDGGIMYSASMGIFYNIFFRNPHANWKYALGFEQGMLPDEDLAILRNIQMNKRGAYGLWVAKMKPADRLILSGSAASKPDIKGLEWKFIADAVWSGRLTRRER